MKNLKNLLIILIIVLLVCSCSFAQDNEKYIVVESNGLGETRLNAVDNALVEALRTASGMFIDSKTELNNDELIENIIVYSRGSISGYEVIAEDASKSHENIYSVKLRVNVERELLRDGVEAATNKTAQIKFSVSDLKPVTKLTPSDIESTDNIAKTNTKNSSSGIEALSAMLNRYNPEDFISFRVVGKVSPVKGRESEDLCQVMLEVSFNTKLYNEAFIPDLKQVLDKISAKKKIITLTKQRGILRNIAANKETELSNNSIILSSSGLGKEYQLAVYDKQDRFGVTLYSFKKDEAEKILNNKTGILAKFRSRIAKIKGFELELLDDENELVSNEEQLIIMPFLMTDSVINDNLWAVHPTILNYQGIYRYVPLYLENTKINIPLRFELPEEFQKLTKIINAKLMIDDDFADSWLNTREALHKSIINPVSYDIARTEFENISENDYPLAVNAFEGIKANDIFINNDLFADEKIDRLEEFMNHNNHTAVYAASLILESEWNKSAVDYMLRAAEINPEAMIRLGEIYEQGFYDLKEDKKLSDNYYREGSRLLTLLADEGHSRACAELGRVYLEGLGVKQNTLNAEKYYEKSGIFDAEYWCWKNYMLSMRQIKAPEKWINQHQDTKCLIYLVREKKTVYEFSNRNTRFDVMNLSARQVANFVVLGPYGNFDDYRELIFWPVEGNTIEFNYKGKK